MKASEILRKMADLIDAREGGAVASTEITNRPAENEVDMPTDTKDIEAQAAVNVDSMVAPLQQKLELLKKGVGLDNAFDNGQISANDDLTAIKRNAGLNPTVIQIASDDEPLDM